MPVQSGAIPPANSLSAYGVDLTPPSPVSYAMPKNFGDISGVMNSVQQGQNQANVANNDRYKQLLAILSQGSTGLNNSSQGAIAAATSGFAKGIGSLQGSLANNQTVYSEAAGRATSDAVKASSLAQQSAISRGLGNTTIADSLQDQVQRGKNDAMATLAADKAKSDNSVYGDLANMYSSQGSTLANLNNQAGANYMSGAGAIANAIGSRNDVGPNLSDYAGLIQSAAAAKNSTAKTNTTTVDPISINSPLRSGGGGGGGGGGISGGIGGSMGQGGFNSGGGGGASTTTGSYYAGPDHNKEAPYSAPSMSPVGPISLNAPGTFADNGGYSTPPDDAGQMAGAAAATAGGVAGAGLGGGGSPDLTGATGVYGMDGKLYGWRKPDGTIIDNPNVH